LTTRLSLMFMLSVTVVLTVTGVSFNHLSQRHFKMLDQQTLDEKLDSTQRILGELHNVDQFSEVKPQLEALLGAHRDLTAIILNSEGKLFFSGPGPVNVPEQFRTRVSNTMWEWQDQEHIYRGVTAQAIV